jgi:hypothetical protein
MGYFKNVGFVYRNASFVLWIKQRTIERTVVLKVNAIKKWRILLHSRILSYVCLEFVLENVFEFV